MCLRSRCVAVRWIQPSDLHVTIEDCSSPSAEPPVPATVHWRQRAALISRTRDRQSGYNPQLCSACAPRTVVRRPLGDHLATRTHASLPLPLPPYPVLVCDRPAPSSSRPPPISPSPAPSALARSSAVNTVISDNLGYVSVILGRFVWYPADLGRSRPFPATPGQSIQFLISRASPTRTPSLHPLLHAQ